MLADFDRLLANYARLAVQVGTNLQAGQRLLIMAPIEARPLVRQIATVAYQLGARLADVMWSDEQLGLIRFQHAPRDSFEEFPAWRSNAVLEGVERGDALLQVLANDPSLLAGQDPELIGLVQRTSWEHFKPAFDRIARNAINWTAITYPTEGWATQVFPNEAPERAVDRLWDAIFDICRLREEDPVPAWRKHIDRLVGRCQYLNRKGYAALKMRGSGTDLTLGLPAGHLWRSGHFTSQGGIDFTANLPTEEIFTLPHAGQAEGVVRSSRPLEYSGNVIEDFTLTFSRGQVVAVTAVQGEAILRQVLATDDGASRLGEVALVPHGSPICQRQHLFLNRLIDENAASHLALGRAYNFSLENGEAMTNEEFVAAGGNFSLTHLDFMFGSGEMEVDGVTADGKREPIMRAGEWAFDV